MAGEEGTWKPDPIRESEKIDKGNDPIRKGIKEGTVDIRPICTNHTEGYCIAAGMCIRYDICWADGKPITNYLNGE